VYDADISLQEIAYRLSHPKWIASQSRRYVQELLARFLPSEFNHLFLKVKPISMVSYARLHGLYEATKYVVKNSIAGDFVECGVARGGSAALMGLTLQQMHVARRLWLFDTFQGLPRPSQNDPDYKIANLYTGTCVASMEEVQNSLRSLGVASEVHLIPGLFQDTVKNAPIEAISLLHLDGDWYESVKVCLDTLYDKVSPGGVIQFDDYGHWAGARKAVDEFMTNRKLFIPFRRLDFSGRQLVKQ
jgi:Macrocin-O-methyltransferase (TylF)